MKLDLELNIDDDFSDIALVFTPAAPIESFDDFKRGVVSILYKACRLAKTEIAFGYASINENQGDMSAIVAPIWDHEILQDLDYDQWESLEDHFKEAYHSLRKAAQVVSGRINVVERKCG